MTRPAPFLIGDESVRPGQRKSVSFPIAKFVTGSPMELPVIALHGRTEGPTVWINAAIHGDEINGVEIVRRVLERVSPATLRGTLLAIPVVNAPGFINGDRYLPDRRDLNRSFPGNTRGSLASRIANVFMREVVSRCTVGIDLHTGSMHRTNLPQVRANLDDPTTRRLALAFDAPVMMHAAIRDGSLRQAAADVGATVLLYEGGEAWRFDEPSIRAGVRGVLRVLAELDMIDPVETKTDSTAVSSRKSKWVRARRSGITSLGVELGDTVVKGQPLGRLHDSLGNRLSQVNASDAGVIIGLNLDPIVNQGDALVHIALIESDEVQPNDQQPTDEGNA